MSNNKPHGFCETPEEKCTMNYCDENGCINRKRNPVGDGDPIDTSNNKQSSMKNYLLLILAIVVITFNILLQLNVIDI